VDLGVDQIGSAAARLPTTSDQDGTGYEIDSDVSSIAPQTTVSPVRKDDSPAFIRISISGAASDGMHNGAKPVDTHTPNLAVDRESEGAGSSTESLLQLSPCMSYTGPNSDMQLVPRCVAQQEEEQIRPEEDEHQSGEGMSSAEMQALAKIKSFCANIMKMLAPLLLKEIESTRTLNAAAEPFTPRRVTRRQAMQATSAATASKPKKVTAAETALIKALGIVPEDLSVNEEDLHLFRTIFDSPLHDQHVRVMASIFGKMALPSFERMESCQVAVAAQ
jgi:hypothetical protein